MNNFRFQMEQSPNVKLYVGEVAFGDRPFEVTSPDNPQDIQFRSSSELFLKENVQKEVIKHWPLDWKYGATIDADFHFTRHDWALETVHQLQHYDFVQLFSSYADLSGDVYGQKDVPLRYNSSFIFNYFQNGCKVSDVYHNSRKPNGKIDKEGYEESMLVRGVGATGGALGFTKSAYEKVDGLMDRCVLGHADWSMMYSLAGLMPPDANSQNYAPDYKHYIRTWFERAQVIKRNIGYVDGFCIHYFHGSKTRRAYSSRDAILAKHQFSPYRDLHQTSRGIWQLTDDKPGLRDDIRQYFISRFEDDPKWYGPEKLLI